jgi:hypothetical protein
MWLASVQQEDGDSDRETARGGHNTHVTKGLLADALDKRLHRGKYHFNDASRALHVFQLCQNVTLETKNAIMTYLLVLGFLNCIQ